MTPQQAQKCLLGGAAGPLNSTFSALLLTEIPPSFKTANSKDHLTYTRAGDFSMKCPSN